LVWVYKGGLYSLDGQPASKTILIADDDESTAELLKEILTTEARYHVTVVRDGAHTLEAIHSSKPNLVLLDIQLPDMDGLQLYDSLQADADTQHIPVLFCTAVDKYRLEERGLTNYIMKPFDIDEFLTRVREACATSEPLSSLGSPSYRKKVIMIVEDDVEVAEIIQVTLNDEPDYQAVAVHDGSRALELIRSVRASLILLDVMLPSMSGFEIYDIMQQDPTTRDIPVLFCTAARAMEEFKKRNIGDFISKPFDLDDLLARVDAICRPTSTSGNN
jgi:DNA-binding response OmpR family regulator